MHESQNSHHDSEPTPVYTLEKEEFWQDEAELLERIVENLDDQEIPRGNVLLTAHGETDDTLRVQTFALTLDECARLIEDGGRMTLLSYAEFAHTHTDPRDYNTNEEYYDENNEDVDFFDDDTYLDYTEKTSAYGKAYISVYDRSKILNCDEPSLYQSSPGETIHSARICTFDVTSWCSANKKD